MSSFLSDVQKSSHVKLNDGYYKHRSIKLDCSRVLLLAINFFLQHRNALRERIFLNSYM